MILNKVGNKNWVVINQWDFNDYSEYVTKFEKVGNEQIHFILEECIKVDGNYSKWKKVRIDKRAGKNLI